MLGALLLAVSLWFSPAAAQDMYAAPVVHEAAPPLPPIPEGWVAVEGPDVSVWGRPSQQVLLSELSKHANASVPRLAEVLGVPSSGGIVVYVAGDDAEFARLQPGRTPEWADGTAWPERGAVFVKSPRVRADGAASLLRVLDHELTHVLLGRAFAPHEPPRWLQEGLARNFAGEQGPDDARRITEGLSRGGIYTLENLHVAFPRDAEGAALAYAESADFIAFLRAEHGDRALRKLIRELAKGETIDAAVYHATGEPLAALDARWRGRFSPGLAASLGAVELGTFAFGLGLIGALIQRRRRLNARMRKMAEDEAARDALIAASRSADDAPPMWH